MPFYNYLTFRLSDIASCFEPIDTSKPDAYLSSEPMTDALRDCLAKGYRWIRTDGEYAIFEKASDYSVFPKITCASVKPGTEKDK